MLRRVLLAAAVSVTFAGAASAATIDYTAKLTGAREVPKTDSKGTGAFKGTLDTTSKVLTYTLTFDKLSGPATAAHLHGPAARAANAGVLAPLGDKNPSSPVSGSVTLTDDQIKELQSGKVYVNVHTAADPSGEIRGQVNHARTHTTAAAKKSAT
jgi:hypothetical protein